MKILVTGCFGFIGYNFLKVLLEESGNDFEVTGIDSLNNPYSKLNHDTFKKANDFEFFHEDILNIEKINFKSFNFDVIINFAAESHVDTSIYNPNVFIESNVMGVNNLLKFCISNKINEFIQISTDEVYGSAQEQFFQETDKLNPSSPYSASKASADMVCNSYAKTYGMKIKTIRPANNYGPYQQPEKLIPYSISNITKENRVEIYGKGLNIRHWLYVKDTVSGIISVLTKGEPGEIYNIGSGVYLTNNELSLSLLQKFDLDETSISYVVDRPGHDFRYSVNFDKLLNLGWKPRHRFEDALEDTVDWYIKNEAWWKTDIQNIRDNRNKRLNK